MVFNISRQPFVPAFLTLLTLAVVIVCTIGAPIETSPATLTAEVVSAANPNDGLKAWAVASPGEGLVIEMPDRWIARFLNASPFGSALLAGVLILFAGMVIGRMTIRYNLYAVSTCIAIPLYGLIACALPTGGNYLAALTASALLALSLKNYARAFCNGYGFDGMLRATGYLGLAVLVVPDAALLVLTLPLAVLIFRRTLREAVVGTFGLLLPLLLLCYINWGAGGSFSAPLQQLAASFTAGPPLGLFQLIPIPILLVLGVILLLNLFALLLFLSDLYNVGTKPRFILIFSSGILLFCAVALCGPTVNAGIIALLAVPSAVLLPVLFVRIQRWLALAIYLLLLAGAVCGIAIQ